MRVKFLLPLLFFAVFSVSFQPKAQAGTTYQKLVSDSVDAVKKADQQISALKQTVSSLSTRISEETNSLKALQQALDALRDKKDMQEGERKHESGRSHAAIKQFDGQIQSQKAVLKTAQGKLETARSDSIAVAEKNAAEMKKLNRELAALKKTLDETKIVRDTLSRTHKRLVQDSIAAIKKNADLLAALSKRLAKLRKSIANNDKAVASTTEKLNLSRQDSIKTISAYANDNRQNDRDMQALDSLIQAAQRDKQSLLGVQEKLKLDKLIEGLTAEMRELAKKGCSDAQQEEKQQLRQTYTGKRDLLLRDRGVAAILNETGKATPKEVNDLLVARLGALEKTLDSAAQTRKTKSTNVVLFKRRLDEQQEEITLKNRVLSDSITVLSRNLVNAKADLKKAEKDSAATFKKMVPISKKYHTKRMETAASLAGETARADSVTALIASLKEKIIERKTAHDKELALARSALAKCIQAVDAVKTEIENMVKQQKNLRTDSSTTEAKQGSLLTETNRLIEQRNEEIRLKKSALDQLKTERKKANDEIKLAEQEKQRQQESFGQVIAEQQRTDALARAEQPAPASTKNKTSGPNAQLSDIAEKRLMKIYNLIEQEKTSEATTQFKAGRDMLEAGLDPEAFSTIQMTIESLEPVPETATVAAAPVVTKRPEPPPPPESEAYTGPRKEGSIFLTSLPPVATVFMDGEQIGKTNIGYIKITSGPHTMRFVKGGLDCTKHMTFIEGKNPSQLVKLPCE